MVVGPSGAGKDSVMGFVRDQLGDRPDIRFVRRAITRPADAGGEAHDAISPHAFAAAEESGAFAVSWEAHGLSYGIPVETLAQLERGLTLIANGSRAALPRFRAVFPRLTIVNIVASPAILAQRLAARGRESEADIRARLSRQTMTAADLPDVVTIDNSGDLSIAGFQLSALVLQASGRTG